MSEYDREEVETMREASDEIFTAHENLEEAIRELDTITDNYLSIINDPELPILLKGLNLANKTSLILEDFAEQFETRTSECEDNLERAERRREQE